jgi:hypothetical protein
MDSVRTFRLSTLEEIAPLHTQVNPFGIVVRGRELSVIEDEEEVRQRTSTVNVLDLETGQTVRKFPVRNTMVLTADSTGT